MIVWSVESVVLGLWALALAAVSPSVLHTFMARSHLILSSFTLAAQLFASSRQLPGLGHAIAEAFVCSVWALLAMYLVVLLDSGNYGDTRLFSMPAFAGLPVDGWVGLGWFVAATASALGMGLGSGRPSRLMFNHFGYHMMIVAPSFLILWLYSSSSAVTITLVGVWVVFIVLQATGQAIASNGSWTALHILSAALKITGRIACIVIPVVALLSVRTDPQVVLMWVLLVIGIVNAFDWMSVLEWALNERPKQSGTQDLVAQMVARPDPAALALHIKGF